MDRIDIPQASGATEPIDPAAETVINGAPYRAGGAHRAQPDHPVDQSNPGLSEEVKQRQIALAVRYVTVLSSASR